jgi:hypothetical protein
MERAAVLVRGDIAPPGMPDQPGSTIGGESQASQVEIGGWPDEDLPTAVAREGSKASQQNGCSR